MARAAVLALRPREDLPEPDPVDVQEYFSPDDIARARRFGRPQLALHGVSTLLQAGVLAWFVAHPLRVGARLERRRRRRGAERPLREAALAGAGLSGLVGLASLPLGALARRRALAAGLATQSWRGWAADVLKSSALEMAFAGAASPVGVALMRRLPRHWWLPGAGVGVAGVAAATMLGPALVDPLFNRYTPLPPGALRDEVLALAARAGVEVGEVYEVDASRRTSAANAYVNGLGPTKRVVLFDTLMRGFAPEETRLVIAHELAHVRHRDVPRGLLYLAVVAPAALYAVAQIAARLQRAAGIPAGEPADAATLPALALALGLVGAPLGCVSSALSRHIERRADAFALALTGATEPFIAFEQRIVRQNLLDPAPPRWLTLLLASHPPAVERIGMARAHARMRLNLNPAVSPAAARRPPLRPPRTREGS